MTAQDKLERVYESLDDLGFRIHRDWMNGNKSDARLQFHKAPPERRGYLAYTIIGRHMTCTENPHITDLDDFFKSVTA